MAWKFFNSNGAEKQILTSAVPILRKNTAKLVTNTITETDLLNGEFTIAANSLGIDKTAVLVARGDWTLPAATTSNGLRFKVKLGGTTIFDTGAPGGLIGDATRYSWEMEVQIANLTASTQWVSLRGKYDTKRNSTMEGLFTTGNGLVEGIVSGTYMKVFIDGSAAAAIDTTISQLLEFTVINPSNTATTETALRAARLQVIGN